MATGFTRANRPVEAKRRQTGYTDVVLWSSERLEDSTPVALLPKGTSVDVIARAGSGVEVRSDSGAEGWLRAIELTPGVLKSREVELDARCSAPWQKREDNGLEYEERAARVVSSELIPGSTKVSVSG